MKVKQTKNYIEAVDNIAMFKHCANGLTKVSKKTFDDEVKPMLFLHNVVCIEFENK